MSPLSVLIHAYFWLQLPQWDKDDQEIEEGPATSAKCGRRVKLEPSDDAQWPDDTHLQDTSAKTLPLLQQDVRIQAVIQLAIECLFVELLFDETFPDAEAHIRLSCQAIIEA